LKIHEITKNENNRFIICTSQTIIIPFQNPSLPQLHDQTLGFLERFDDFGFSDLISDLKRSEMRSWMLNQQ